VAKTAFLGTGLLGGAMVEGLLRRGDAVTVWNRTESKARALERFGARVAKTAADAVAEAEHVHMTLPDDEVVDAMIARIRPRLAEGAIVIDHSTTSPPGADARIRTLNGEGARFLHAPVFMSPQMARDSVGLMLVSGPKAAYESVQSALAPMTGDVWYLGERGDLAAAYKLFGNSMLFTIAGGVADILAMAKSLGVPPIDAVGLFSKFHVGGALKARGEKMARGDFSASFELSMARKDIRLMIEAAGAQPLTVLPHIAKKMDAAIAHGHGSDDLGVIAAEAIS
jgi:3-hydroxyisobutyrate dehydrogenase-like beta-hydroxyacid dehydrogenase